MIAFRLSAKLPASVDSDDMIQVGMIGLWRALASFDGRASDQFKPFATPRIRGAMVDELRRTNWVYRQGHRLIDLDDLLEDESRHSLIYYLSDHGADPAARLEDQRQRQALASALDSLPARDARLMAMHYVEDMDFKAIGAVLDITGSRASQSHGEIVAWLRAEAKHASFREAFPEMATPPAKKLEGVVTPADDTWMHEYGDLVRL